MGPKTSPTGRGETGEEKVAAEAGDEPETPAPEAPAEGEGEFAEGAELVPMKEIDEEEGSEGNFNSLQSLILRVSL